MGIDKSNVRYRHSRRACPSRSSTISRKAAAPGATDWRPNASSSTQARDYLTWKRILEESESQTFEIGKTKLGQMYRYCSGVACRHRAILGYFGQHLDKENCRACDICLGEIEGVPDASGGSAKDRFQHHPPGRTLRRRIYCRRADRFPRRPHPANKHDTLSTYGLLEGFDEPAVRDWIEQLAEQECIERTGEYGVLKLTEKGRRLLKGMEQPLLLEPAEEKTAPKPSMAKDSWEGVDRRCLRYCAIAPRAGEAKSRARVYRLHGCHAARPGP